MWMPQMRHSLRTINVAAARESGLRAFHVNGLAEVERALFAEGWL
jgi:hypothetical protein